MSKSSSIFDLFGIDMDAINKLSDISLKDYIKDNENITGAFNELSDEKKKKVVESMNKIQKTFSDVFGTKVEEFTEDDFKNSKVDVSTKVYDNTDDSKKETTKEVEEKKPSSEYVFTEAPDVEPEVEDECEDDTPETFDVENCKGCEHYDSCLEVYKDAVCENNCEGCDQCEFYDDCCSGDDSDDWDDEDNDYDESDDEEMSICEELLSELEDEDTSNEELVDSIVEYVLAILGEKKHKKYILHPGTSTVPPAVEVKIPSELATTDILQNIHVMTMLREVLIDTTGGHDAYINQGENKTVVVYIPLKKM